LDAVRIRLEVRGRSLPDLLADLVKTVEVRDAAVLLPVLLKHESETVASMTTELKRTLEPNWNDLPLEPAWTTPGAMLVDKITAAQGMLEERFAFCQTMTLDEFLGVADGLRASGYRPVCFRPFAVADSILVAAIWTRDGQSWQMAHDLSAAELRKQESAQRQKGFLPLDVAIYVSQGSERYAALWAMPDANVADARLDVEMSGLAFLVISEQMEDAEFVPHTGTLTRTGNQHHYTVVWRKPAKSAGTVFFHAGKDQAWYESILTPSELLTDVRLSPQEQSAGYSAIWNPSADLVSAESHDLDPVRHLDRCRQLTKEGYRPVSISAVSLQDESPVTPGSETFHPRTLVTSVWHRPVVPDAAKVALAKSQARAAVTLLRLDRPDRLWHLLQFDPDPTVRTYVIHLLQPFGVDPQKLIERLLHEEPEVSARRAILLALGEFRADSLPGSVRQRLIGELRKLFQDDPDSGIHSSVEWLLRHWGEENLVAQSETKLISRDPMAGRRWYVNAQGQTMAIIPGPVEFWMGSPGSEPERMAVEEDMHHERIPRSFAIATTEVTTEQFRRFLEANPKFRRKTRFLGREREPIGFIEWAEAVQYCRWLSKEEKIPEEEWCYPPLEEIKPGMQLLPDCEARIGYRLPTEKEWEYACRAGSITSRTFGSSSEMLVNYGWYLPNSGSRARRVGQLKPNDFGLFDMHGNVGEWCQDQVPGASYRLKRTGSSEAQKGTGKASEHAYYAWRGAPFSGTAARVRSAAVTEMSGDASGSIFGFRVARTVR
jgi:formylglycine-generating enzyme required for sulfatase activity